MAGGKPARELLAELLPDDDLDGAGAGLPDALRLRGALLYRGDAGRGRLVPVAQVRSDDEPSAPPPEVEFDDEDCATAEAWRVRTPQVAPPTGGDPGTLHLPLVRGDSCLGVLCLTPGEGLAPDDLRHEGLRPVSACITACLQVTSMEAEAARLRERADRTQRELVIGRALLDSLMDGSGDGILLLDRRGRVQRSNGTFASFFDLAPNDLVGLSAAGLAELVARHRAPDQEDLPWAADFHSARAVGSLVLREPTERILALRATPIRDENHRPSGTLFLARDETRHESSNRMKTEFVATVSHELRTPLTSLHGALRILESLAGDTDPARPERSHFLGMAVRNTERLIRLLDDILDVERIEQGRVELNPQRFAADSVLRDSVEDMRAFADERGVALRWYAPPGAHLVGDRDRIHQVLVNLLSNAIKFSAAGEAVSARARVVMQGLRFSVQDRGPGIPPDQHERIFERFRQGDSSSTRRAGGTGLGLAISKAIIEEHGGRMWLRSVPGQGSTFYFQIPLSRSGAGVTRGEDLTDEHGTRVGD